MPQPTVRHEVHDEVAVLVLDRPHRLNALTVAMLRELEDALDAVDDDEGVRAVVLTGAGRAFCAGADVTAGSAGFAPRPDDEPGAAPGVRADRGGRLALRLLACTKPVVAAVNGDAAGAGATLTLAADVRLAAPGSRFGFVFTRRGLVPESTSTWLLPRLVGLPTALDWVLGARMVEAADALEAGLVAALHEPDRIVEAAVERARAMVAGTSPVATAWARQLLLAGSGDADPRASHERESLAVSLRARSADLREGVAAFLERRPPAFPDRVAEHPWPPPGAAGDVDVVLVHGGGQGAWAWDEVVEALARQAGPGDGLGRVLALDVPGCGTKRDRDTAGLDVDDVAADLLADVDAAGVRRAVVVGHSQAGTVLPRLVAARPGTFVAAVHVSCSAPAPGQTIAALMGTDRRGEHPEEVGWVRTGQGPEADRRAMFCNDMDPDQVARFGHRWGHDAWPDRCRSADASWASDPPPGVASTYVLLLRDAALPLPWQERFAARLGVDRTVRIDAGHQVMQTRPHALAEVVLAEVRRASQDPRR